MKHTLIPIIFALRGYVYRFLSGVDHVLNRKNQLFILSYHSLASDDWRFSVNVSEFKRQINYLSKHYSFISLKELSSAIRGQKTLAQPSVILTFDDGYKDVLQVKEFLAKKHIQPALFLMSDTRHTNWTELATKRPFLTKREVLGLAKAGWEIGSHSATHANLATVSNRDQEVIGSKKTLEKELGLPIKYFAYPRGKYSSQVLQAVKKANYQLALTMDDGVITSATDPLLIPRIGIDRSHSFAEFTATFSPSVVQLRKQIKETFLGRYL